MTSNIDKLFLVSVEEAVQKSMQNHQPLFVFLSRNDEMSQKFAEGLLDTSASDEAHTMCDIVKQKFVGLRLIEETVEYGYFKQIFHNLIVPSFYIVNNGQLLDVITEDCTREQFKERISKVPGSPNSINADNYNENSPPEATRRLPPQGPPEQHSNASRQSLDSHGQDHGNLRNQNHDQSVVRHKKQIEALRRAEKEEKNRIRALLEADKRERHSRQNSTHTNKANEVEKTQAPNKRKFGACSLSIKLFDGNSLKHDFKPEQTLNDVRSWLDNATDNQIIPNPNASLPSFATASYPHPTHYVFHNPVLPRITYSDDQEFTSLLDLGLCPRSVLILKPIYDTKTYLNAYPNGQSTAGVLTSVGGALSKFGNAIYSFFDYSVGDMAHDYDSLDDMNRPRSPLMDSDENIRHRSPELVSGNEGNLNSPASERVEEYFDARIRSGAGTPNILSINTGSQPSLINFDSNASPVPFSRIPSTQTLESDNINASNFNRHRSTPKPISSIPSVSNIQTIHQESTKDSKNDSKHESKNDLKNDSRNDSDDRKRDRNTYNGNGVNLGDHQDD